MGIWEPERLGREFAPRKNGQLALHVEDLPRKQERGLFVTSGSKKRLETCFLKNVTV